MKYYTNQTYIGWIILAGIISLLFNGLLKVGLILTIDFQFTTIMNVILFILVCSLMFALFFYTQRNIRYIELSEEYIAIEYYSNLKTPRTKLDIQDIVAVDICTHSIDKKEVFYKVHTKQKEEIHLNTDNILPLDFKHYCMQNRNKVNEKDV